MYFECRHVYPSGRKCKLAHINDSDFCYSHRNFREHLYAPPARPGTPFRLPSLEDEDGCVMAIQQVSWAMGEKRVTQKEAGTYLYGISLAMRLLPRRRRATRTTVRALCYDSSGIEMAEAVEACDPPQDCLTCKKHCHWFDYYEDEVEELEEQKAEEERQNNPDSAENAGQPGKYDHELPNIRALLENIDRKAEEQQRQREEQARLKAAKQAQPEKPPQPDTQPRSPTPPAAS